jgi:4'-phosphopantetheinyl transferase
MGFLLKMSEIALMSARCSPQLLSWLSGLSKNQLNELLARLGIGQQEQERIERYRQPIDRLRTILGRLLAYTYFNRLYNNGDKNSQHRLIFARNDHDRPVLIEPIKSDNFSISHHGDWVVFVGAAQSPDIQVGIDVVSINERPSLLIAGTDDSYFQLMSRVFTEREFESIMRLPARQARWTRFYRLWAIKESYAKALGKGLSIDLQSVEVHCADEETGSVGAFCTFQTMMLDDCHLVALSTIGTSDKCSLQFKQIDCSLINLQG